jgi:hypothetical protein
MKYNWKLVHHGKRLKILFAVPGGAYKYKRNNYSREFGTEDAYFLDFLLSELTYIPDWISPHKIQKIQHRLGNAVWDKLGERDVET